MELDKETLLVIIASLQLIDEKIHQLVDKSVALQSQIEELVAEITTSDLPITSDEIFALKQALGKNDLLDIF